MEREARNDKRNGCGDRWRRASRANWASRATCRACATRCLY